MNMKNINIHRMGMWLGVIGDIAAIAICAFLVFFKIPVSETISTVLIFAGAMLLFLTMLDAYDDLCSYATQKQRLPITFAIALLFSLFVILLVRLVFPKLLYASVLRCMAFFVLSCLVMLAGRRMLLRMLIRIRSTQTLLILYCPGCPESFLKKLVRKAVDFAEVELCEVHDIELEDEVIEKTERCDHVLILGNIPVDLRDKYILYAFAKGKGVQVIPTVENLSFLGGRIRHIGDTPVIGLKNAQLTAFEIIVKRCFDFVGALLGIVVSSPIFLLCAAAIKLDSPGPVFYKQERYTIHKRKFDIIKFRTMIRDAEKYGALLATENDKRITRIGHFLRKCRLDELPQLINILKGEMSFVGPRPERPVYADRYSEMVKNYDIRYLVKAGLTGYAQIYGQYNTKVSDKVLFDSIYINNFSMWLDMKLIVQTALIMFIKESTEGVDENMAATPAHKHDARSAAK